MESSAQPIRHHPRLVRACQGDLANLADQTTARLEALNGTLTAIAISAADPNQQSKEERNARRALRRELYAEIGRLVGPAERVELSAAPKPSDMIVVVGQEVRPQ